MKKILLCIFIILIVNQSFAQLHTFDIGLKFQKTQDLYYENGLTAQYNLTSRWLIGASLITSRLGSAMGSNAIKQDNFLSSATYLFRSKKSLKTFVKGNLGYFNADYESDIFKNLTHSSAIVSTEAGLSYTFKNPLKVNLSIGYNLITGDGESGAGTLFPVFYQTSITYNFKSLFQTKKK
jgi:hypothetical protein